MRKIKLCIMATMLCLLFGCGEQEKTANKTIQETTTAEINDVTTSWLNAMGSDEKKGVISWLTQVNKIYKQLLTDGQKDFLTSAGFGDAPYPWSSTPLETVNEIMKKAGIK